MLVRNAISASSDGRIQRRSLDSIDGVLIHRVGIDRQTNVELGFDGQAISDAFCGRNPRWAEVAAATNGQNPYTFILGGDWGPIEYDGVIWQILPLGEIGHHARRWSRTYIGVACIGDFRSGYGNSPSSRQWTAAVELVAALSVRFGFDASEVLGHGEKPGAHGGEKAPGKPAACPGGLWNMTHFRQAIESRRIGTASDAMALSLELAGIS